MSSDTYCNSMHPEADIFARSTRRLLYPIQIIKDTKMTSCVLFATLVICVVSVLLKDALHSAIPRHKHGGPHHTLGVIQAITRKEC